MTACFSEKLKAQWVLRETTVMFPQLRCVLAVLFLVLITLSQHVTPAAAQMCPQDGDVNQNDKLTPADALLAFRHSLGNADPPLTDCQRVRANVLLPVSSPITPKDALCILQQFLGLPSCFPAQFEFPDGDEIRVPVDTPIPLHVRIVNASRTPVAEARVTFRLVGNSTQAPVEVLTDADGSASTTLTAGATPGHNVVEVDVAGLTPVESTIIGVAKEKVRGTVKVMGQTQPAPLGTLLDVPLVVKMLDELTGNPVAGVEVTVEVRGVGAEITARQTTLAQSSGQKFLPAQTSGSTTAKAVTNAQGEARFVVQGMVGADDITAKARGLDQMIEVTIVRNETLLPNPNNTSPQVSSSGAQSFVEGDAVTLQIDASDSDDDPLVFTAANLPPGLSIVLDSGLITGTIDSTAAQGSPYEVTVTVSDGTATTSVFSVWTVTPSDAISDKLLALHVTASPDPVRQGGLLTYTLTVSNQGEVDLTGVVLETLVPEHTSASLRLITDGASCSTSNCFGGARVEWQFGTLLASQSRTVEMTVNVTSGFGAPPDGTLLRSNARVQDAEGFIAVSETYTRVCTRGETTCDVSDE